MYRHLSLVTKSVVEALQQGPSTRQHDPAVHDVRGQLGRGAVECLLDRVDDRLDRFLDRHPNFFTRQDDGLRKARDKVASADLRLDLLVERERRSDLQLDLLGGLRADHQLVLALHVVRDRLVDLVATDANRLRDDDAAQGDDRNLGGAATDVDDHVPAWLADRKPGADRSGHRLLDKVCLTRAGRETGLFHRALLDPGDARGDAYDYARMCPAVLMDLLDEVTEHLLGHVEVCDHAVLERADRLDGARRAAEHPLRLDTHGVKLGRARVDRDDAALGPHDSAPAHVNQRVRCSKVDGHVTTAEAGEIREETHLQERRRLEKPAEGPAHAFSSAVPGFQPGSADYSQRPKATLAAVFEQSNEFRHRQTDHIPEIAVDSLDQRRPSPLDRVTTS